ncbi:MAG: helix-turn-helix domain-containing protein [Clostridia bacterium]|nr:helix-turn-helix domain-containing protein [Clostridia bacterium]
MEEVAEILGICKANAYNLCHNKDFPSVKVGNRIFVPRPAFVLWMTNPKGG